MVDFCDINKRLTIFICFCLITFQSCSNHSDALESDVLAYQTALDSLIETVIVPIKSDIDKEIAANNIANKDTFELARQRIPLTTVQFLISNEYFVLDSLLTAYQNHKIPAENLTKQLETSRYKVDSLINSEVIQRFSE